jgi:hypothetical protein
MSENASDGCKNGNANGGAITCKHNMLQDVMGTLHDYSRLLVLRIQVAA